MTKASRIAHARDATQGHDAAADRASARPLQATIDEPGSARPRRARSSRPRAASKPTTAFGDGTPAWSKRAAQAERAVDDDRRRRREQALTGHAPDLPARLGDSFRRGNLFLLADTEEEPGQEGTS